MKGRNIVITLVFVVCVALLLKASIANLTGYLDKKIDNQITQWARASHNG